MFCIAGEVRSVPLFTEKKSLELIHQVAGLTSLAYLTKKFQQAT